MAQIAGKKHIRRITRAGGKQSGKRDTARGMRSRKPVATNAKVILLNKPFGYVSQFSGADNCLADLVKIKGVYPAGRLDKDSEGLLILTDHGALQHRISHPKMKWQKRYWAQVEGEITDEALQHLCRGVTLRDGNATALSATRIDPPRVWPRNPPVRYRASVADCWIDLTLNEGRNRQVRRMTASVGFPTLRLIRHQIGPWVITGIESGKYQTMDLNPTDLEDFTI